MEETKSCCQPNIQRKDGIKKGILYGILPHSFCITFILFSVIGATIATTFLKKLLLLPFFFPILIGFSFFFAAISAAIYLQKLKMLNISGIKARWKYLSILFGTTIAVNLLFFFVIFPFVANIGSGSVKASSVSANLSSVVLRVQIPCSGHAPLISGEIKKLSGIKSVNFSAPNRFLINYDPKLITPENILSSDIFKSFPANIERK